MNKRVLCIHITSFLTFGFLISVSTVSLAQEKTIDAANLYHDYCSVCHGDNGDGESRAKQGLIPPPRDFTTPGLADSLSREAMINIISDGRKGTAMAGWKTRLNNQEISAIVDYIRNNFMQVKTTTLTDHAKTSRASQIYTHACSVCHGDRGNGAVWASSTLNPPPRDFTREHISRERIISAITHGRQGTAMPSFKSQYSSDEIAEVADFLLSNFVPAAAPSSVSKNKSQSATAQTDFFAQPYPGSLKPDIKAGEALYRFNCATCHGDSGAGNGPRAYFIFPRPRNFLSDASRSAFNRPAIYRAVHDGVPRREMPAWRYVLNAQEMANVSEYVFQSFIRSKPDRQ